jgi:cell division protein FtsN
LPRTDDGEFELVLGNKQLLSVFFIMVVLLGVFFAMGYIAGRNSTPIATDAAKKEGPIVVDSSARTSPMPEAGAQAAPQPAQPAADTGTPTQPVASAPPAREKAPAEAPPAAPKPAPAQEASTDAGGAPQVVEPEKGTVYLQVSATARQEAEVVAGTLSKRGFKTQLAPGPNESIFRVLVGPLKDASEIARTKADLVKAGFGPIVKRF